MTPVPDPAPSSAAAADPAPERLVGKRVHKYDIVRVIGRGGMGTVYEAVNTAIGKRVAMKFIDAAQNADNVARFQREAQAASAVESAHIVEIFDSGTSEEGQPFIVMELLRGEDLGHRIKRCGRLELAEALHVTGQILRGLHRAHKAGIVHRDLKPDNIFLVDRDDDPDFAKILDFGISKVRRDGGQPVHTLTRQGTVLGTPFYMSPEQAQAQPDVDARSDLWSVGAILYECLTGRPPYTGATYEQVIVNICMNDAEDVRLYNPGVPEGIAWVIARALARKREDRLDDARAFLDALRNAAGGVMSAPAMSDDSFSGMSSSPALLPVSSARGAFKSNNGRRSSHDDLALDATVKFHSTPPPDQSPLVAVAQERRRAAAQKQRRTFVLVAVSALLAGGLSAFVVARTWTRQASAGSSVVTATTGPVVTVEPQATAPSVTPTVEPVASATVEPVATAPVKSAEPKVRHPKPPPTVATTRPKPTDTGTGIAPDLQLKTD